MRINTNTVAHRAANAAVQHQRVLGQSMERLSTGLRINSAADDAAGLAITSRMTTQISGLNQAIRNANDAVSMLQIADGGLANVESILFRMKEIAVQAGSDSNTFADKTALQGEISELTLEVDRIAMNTQFNNKTLLDGSVGRITIAAGANAGQTVDLNFASIKPNQLGSGNWSKMVTIPGRNTTSHGGSVSGEEMGGMVAMTADGNSVAIGAPRNHGTGTLLGIARVLDWNGKEYSQRGNDIVGEMEVAGSYTLSGSAIAISDSGNTLVVGARGDDGTDGSFDEYSGSSGTSYTDIGHVRVHDWNGSSWQQRGADIDGENTGDMSGNAVAVNGDGNTIAIGAINNDGNGQDSGHVRVYQWSGSAWTQVGSDIDGEANNDNSGVSISLSTDGRTLAVGADNNDGANGSDSGHVRVYDLSGSQWVQRGVDIDGESASDYSGVSVDLSGDGKSLVVGAKDNDGNGSNAGHARVFDWSGSRWEQRGSDIDGESSGDQSGSSATISNDGQTVVLGAPGNDGAGDNAGHARIYSWNGFQWGIQGTDVDGSAANALNGTSVGVSSDGTRMVTGSPGADNSKGEAIVFQKKTLNNVNVIYNAAFALDLIEDALTTLNKHRGDYGAMLSRMDHITDNLTNISLNTSFARSQILDADYAAETSMLASKRMANEAALTMVSQANQQASVVQHLLKAELSKRIQ
ncbi:MAG: flagellin [Cellvibrionales bacterium]